MAQAVDCSASIRCKLHSCQKDRRPSWSLLVAEPGMKRPLHRRDRNIPHLMKELIPQATFFTQVGNRGILGHYVATASLATGV
jgi:hypothetical protein